MRQYDLEILQSIKAISPESVRLGVTASGGGSRAVTGLQKLAQRYVVALLTALGSVRFDSTFGTDVVAELAGGVSRSAAGVSNAFNFASADALDTLRSEDSDTLYGDTPDDERLARARLLDFNVDISSGTLYLDVQLDSVAGDAYVYQMPVTILRN